MLAIFHPQLLSHCVAKAEILFHIWRPQENTHVDMNHEDMKAGKDKVSLLTFEMSDLRTVQTFIYLPRLFQRYESTLAKHNLLQNQIVLGLELFSSLLQVFVIRLCCISVEYNVLQVTAVSPLSARAFPLSFVSYRHI